MQRYSVQLAEPIGRLVVLEAPLGPDMDSHQLQWIAAQADVVVMVVDAMRMDEHCDGVFSAAISDALPGTPVIVVLTFVDQLAGESWQPRYDWQKPLTNCDYLIRDTIDDVRRRLGYGFAGILPACTDSKQTQIHGIAEWIIPAVAAAVRKDQASIFLRAIEHPEWGSADAERAIRRCGRQLLTAAGRNQPSGSTPRSLRRATSRQAR